ncbi:type I-E CRISPR-associated protein Cse1/CasA [Rhodovulum steppense]|uniref:CRISPR system Cascade subunit CasA n=1 Tax=Rhodovulum steppense TaxID=540251 RepID=A0A4R1YIT7_9RHOB|nr:type I-E CRISPR-associated protein Cse1/CasA [Rhodovulum steppense]TCM76392.1 CRISPR system Cascade subunit CasA [Rhodovulum steppense]
MPLNLIENPWIPVLCADGARRTIAPWQMTEPDILRPDWPRADLNIACHELLIGLVFLADPPANNGEWQRRTAPDPQRLKDRLAPFAPAFNLLSEGPRFLQELEPLAGAANPVDMLFIDSSGANAAKNNADLMVHRGRYPRIDLPLAAMTLYAFQAHAPAGGAGNRTSMRGGGPLVTLVDPGEGLWSLVWANVPCGAPGKLGDLPWMRPTNISDKGQQTLPPEGQVFGAEAFFGMPRRLRLIGDDEGITGVIQKPWGTNYALWKHPLSPHYRLKPGEEWLPKHPRAGRFGYRNWLGVVAQEVGSETSERSLSLRDWGQRGGEASIIVAGWAMDNMKPRDFTLSVQPLLNLPVEAEDRLVGMILAAEAAGVVLRGALEPVLAAGEAREAEREAFFAGTEDRFLKRVQALKAGDDPRGAWLADLRKQALRQFDALAVPGLDQRETDRIARIVEARKHLAGAFAGFGKQGRDIFTHLGMEPPAAKKGKAA